MISKYLWENGNKYPDQQMVGHIIKSTIEECNFFEALSYNSRSCYMYKRIKFIANANLEVEQKQLKL